MTEYVPRILDEQLRARLRRAGAVVIEGPRACGKTRTALQVAASSVLLDASPGLIDASATDPGFVLEGDRPRLIDEWQLAPGLWNAARHLIDASGEDGLFIFTGSVAPTEDVTRHSGAGRFSRLRMRPLSLLEQGVAPGGVSLRGLADGARSAAPDAGRGIRDIVEASCRGGWPGNLRRPLEDAMASMRDYVREIEAADIDPLSARRRDPARVRAVMQALARNVATEVKMATLARDAGALAGLGSIDPETVASYMAALERVHVLEQQPAWRGHLRSSAPSRVTPKRHFVDPSIAVAALQASAADIASDLEYLGLLFESLVVRDLRILASPSEGTVSHLRTAAGLEVDAIVAFGYRSWIACEIKMAAVGPRVEAAAASLRALADRVDVAREGAPAALVVIVGSGPAYVRPDGVHVVPIWAIEP